MTQKKPSLRLELRISKRIRSMLQVMAHTDSRSLGAQVRWIIEKEYTERQDALKKAS